MVVVVKSREMHQFVAEQLLHRLRGGKRTRRHIPRLPVHRADGRRLQPQALRRGGKLIALATRPATALFALLGLFAFLACSCHQPSRLLLHLPHLYRRIMPVGLEFGQIAV